MANLPISVETDQLAGLEKAFDGITKAVGGLSKMTPQLSKVLEQAAAKAEKLAKANEEQGNSVDRATRILERQKGILAEMSRDYTRGEASVLEYAKAAGATKTQIKELETTLKSIRSVMGTDPFDNSIGAIRRYQTENKVLAETFKSLKSGAALSNTEIRDLIRVKQQATEAAKREGAAEQMTQSSIRNLIKLRVKEATDAYKEEIALNRQLTKQMNDYKESVQRAAAVQQGFSNAMRNIVNQGLSESLSKISNVSQGLTNAFETLSAAGKKVDNTIEQIEKQLALMGAGFTKESSRAIIAFQNQLVAAGKTQQEIGILTARYQGLLLRMQQVSAENRKTASSFLGLQTVLRQAFPAVGAVGLVATMTQLGAAAVRAADDMTLFRSRLQFVLQEGQSFDDVFGKLTLTANENRQALTDVVTLFNRIAPAMNAAGRSTNEILTVVDSFSKTLLISGANTREASSAILQFSQAMAAGRLNGDEFRSITEAAPEFLRRFAQATGVAAESLKELSADGKLTSQVIADALIVMSDSVKAASGSITINMAQAFQILKNNLTVTIDEINQASGATEAMAGIILDASDIVRGIGDAITYVIEEYGSLIGTTAQVASAIGITVGVYAGLTSAFVANTAAAVTNAFVMGSMTKAMTALIVVGKALNTVLLLNPFVLLASAVVGLTVAFTDLGFAQSELSAKTEQLQNLQKAIPETMEKIIDLEDKRDRALASGNMEKAAKLETDVAKARELLRLQTANQANAQKRFNDLQVEAGISTKASSEEIEKAMARIDAWRQSLTGANKSTDDLTKKNNELQFELDMVGKSTIEVAEARRILTLATAEQVELEGLMLLRSDKLTDAQASQALELINRAQAMRLNADLEVRLAKARENHNNRLKSLNKSEKERDSTLDFQKTVLEEVYKERDKNIENILKGTEATIKEVDQIKEQTDKLNLTKEALREKELATLDASIASSEAALADSLQSKTTDAVTFALQDQIESLKELRKAKENLYNAEDNQKIEEQAKKVAEKQAKEFEKVQDDIAKAITNAIFEGGDKGSDLLKKMFKAQVYRIVIEPTIRGGVEALLKTIGFTGGEGGLLGGLGAAGGIGGALQTLAAGSNAGIAGAILSQGFQLAGEFAQSAYAFTAVGQKFAGLAAGLGKIAPYAGSIVQALQGDFRGAIGGAAGTYVGTAVGTSIGTALGVAGSVAGPIGAAIGAALGSALGGKLFGGGKISATALSPEFGAGVTKTLDQQYKDVAASLGGTALGNVVFGAGGNTGRQGQNPNFTIGASVGGRGVFNSRNTREGQADGLFLAGEIALNEANLADQSLRALFAVLKETDFADNIDAVIDSVDTFGDSFEKLGTALADAQLLKAVNEEFPKLGGALATLAGKSLEVVKGFIVMAGGLENLQAMQNQYISNIYTEEEQLALAAANLNDAFEQLGISVPSTTAEYKALVDAQNLSTVEGQKTYLSLLQLSGAFKQIKDAQQQALEEQLAEQERILEEQQRAAEEAAEALRELAEAYDEVRKKTQDYIAEITGGALTDLERNARSIAEVTAELNAEEDAMERIRLEGELSDLIFNRYQLEKQQIEELQAVISEVFSAIQTEADNVSQARDSILGVQTTTGSRQSIAQRIAQVSGTSFNATAAQANLTAEVERFKTSSLNAVSVLGKLREETVRYYEQQKALSELMKGTASSIRASISQVQFADLTPQQQLQNLEAQFASLYATALTSSGSTLANTGAELQSLIGPLLEKASEIYASGPEFQRIKELVLGQAGTVADKLDTLAPENYQQESLSLLDQIDQSLIGLKTQADLANQALIASLETASDRAVAALNNLMLGLLGPQVPVTTQPVTQPALNAPVATLASAEFSGNSATTGGSFGAIVDELKALREDVKNSGDIQIKVVTTDGRVLVDETLTQIKNRSKRGELVIFADGVK